LIPYPETLGLKELTFVHGFIVGPTPNPACNLLSITQFRRKDFPVQYFPATPITPTFSLIDFKNSTASSET